ncbi:MAG: PAS domain S-box protein [Deltaproteobacteria bacterium]|nr:PAS domain S-box protein [Deltaproteobacteria bacterium]
MNETRLCIMKTDTRKIDSTFIALAEKSIAGIYLVHKGRFFFVNENVSRYTQYPAADMIGIKADSLIHPDDRKWVKKEARRMLRGENSVPYIFRIIAKDGQIRWVMERVWPYSVGPEQMILGNTMNVTDRRQAQEQLRASEDLYRTIFETTGTAMLISEDDTTVSVVNTEFEKLSGAGKDFWEGKRSWREFVDKKDLKRMLRYHRDRRNNPDSAPQKYEFQFLDQKGNTRQVIMLVSMIPGTKRSVAALVDITERMLAEQKLQASDVLYRTIFETTGTAMSISEEDTMISLVNSEFEKLSGAGKDYWQGKHSWKEYMHPEDVGRSLRYHRDRRIDPDLAPRVYEFRFLDRHGKIHDVLNTIAVIPETKQSVSSYIDITDRKKYEQALIRREAELQEKSSNLEELNAALRVLLKQRDEDKTELEDNVFSVLNQLVMPYIEKLKKSPLKENEMNCIRAVEAHLKEVTSSFVRKLSAEHLKLSPRELQMAGMIKEGRMTKEIADLMNISKATVEIHRHHIRKKLGLKGKKTNLTTYLSSLT